MAVISTGFTGVRWSLKMEAGCVFASEGGVRHTGTPRDVGYMIGSLPGRHRRMLRYPGPTSHRRHGGHVDRGIPVVGDTVYRRSGEWLTAAPAKIGSFAGVTVMCPAIPSPC